MRLAYRLIAASAFLLTMTTYASAQGVSVAGDMLKDWQQQKMSMVGIADAMPEDKFGYKSTPAQRSYGEQVMHIVQTDVRFIGALGGKTAAPMADAKASASKAASMAALRESFAYGEAVIKEFNDQQWLERINGIFMGPSVARLRLVYFDMGHSQDIYGQMAVYLRLNGLVPPASDRP